MDIALYLKLPLEQKYLGNMNTGSTVDLVTTVYQEMFLEIFTISIVLNTSPIEYQLVYNITG